MKLLKLCLVLVLTSLSSISNAEIVTENFRIMMAPKVAKSTAGYGVIKNTGDEADTLISICSDTVDVMFHKTEIRSGMAKMIHLSDVVIEAGQELVLEPMSYHLMLFDFHSAEFKEGGKVTLFLNFKEAGVVKVEASIVTRDGR